MPIDHILIAVTDLVGAAQMVERHYGLASIEGGRHPGWGTANRIVPLGDAYLELVAVVDAAQARDSTFGRWILTAEPNGPRGWAVRTDDIEAVARRLGLAVHAGSRTTPRGDVLRWRSAGLEQAIAERSLPFFIEWSKDTRHPGTTAIRHPAGAAHLSRLEIQGDPRRLSDWLGGEELPIAVTAGAPSLSKIVISGDGREISYPQP